MGSSAGRGLFVLIVISFVKKKFPEWKINVLFSGNKMNLLEFSESENAKSIRISYTSLIREWYYYIKHIQHIVHRLKVFSFYLSNLDSI